MIQKIIIQPRFVIKAKNKKLTLMLTLKFNHPPKRESVLASGATPERRFTPAPSSPHLSREKYSDIFTKLSHERGSSKTGNYRDNEERKERKKNQKRNIKKEDIEKVVAATTLERLTLKKLLQIL